MRGALSRAQRHALHADIRALHEAIRAAVSALLNEAARAGRPELANAPTQWGAGDLGYRLDEVAEAALDDFGTRVGARHPLVLVAEGPGVRRYGASASGPPLRAIIDPVDGTRSLMHELRSAWALTGVAPDRGADTHLSDLEVCVQTELPVSTAGRYRVLSWQLDDPAQHALHDVSTGAALQQGELRVSPELPLDNGYLCFTRYLPVERSLVAALEHDVLDALIAAHDLSPRLLYDDNYLCSAGQLFLVSTGRYRLLADLRGWLRATRGLPNFTAKPYDLACLPIYRAAGVPVLDAQAQPLDAPLDTETPLDVLAFGNERLREVFEPLVFAAMQRLA
ncbi:MAG: hypothetical protein DHS20C15_17410 [Planctomycetota bacterium]|nr:MAG: hypothetical protein DHS20C15_17410 [Planctomycetota bacterium]